MTFDGALRFSRDFATSSDSRRSVWTGIAILSASAIAGMALFSLGSTPSVFSFFIVAAGGIVALLLWPELALALYVVVGDVKGDDRVSSLLPVDFTLLLAAILVAGIAFKFLRGNQPVRMPASYFLFIVLVGMMAPSLTYTPVFESGLEKLIRFLTVTGLVIVAPFAVLDSLRAFKRFLAAFAVAAFSICAWSLAELGGDERLVTPSNNTIGLGHVACALIFLIWFGIISRCRFRYRVFTYPLLAVPALALIGSGSRGPALACAAVILVSVLFLKRLRLDLLCLALLGLAAIPFAGIPEAALGYLGTLTNSADTAELLGFRSDLLAHAWSLIQQHPVFGVGLQGFRYSSPNPALYNWPHNIFMEMASELGLIAALLTAAIFACAAREAFRQLRRLHSAYSTLSQLAAALLLSGVINATNTGDINSDRSTWLFVSLVFVLRGLIIRNADMPSSVPRLAVYELPVEALTH